MINFDSLIKKCRLLLVDCLEKGVNKSAIGQFKDLSEQVDALAISNKAVERLKFCLGEILKCNPGERSQKLLELNSVIQKISVALIKVEAKTEGCSVNHGKAIGQFTNLKHSEVKHLIRALTSNSSARANLLRLAAADQRFHSLNLLPYYVSSIDDRSSEVVELLFSEILPRFGSSALPLMRKKFHLGNTVGQMGVLAFLLKYESDEESRRLCRQISENGNSELKKYILSLVSFDRIDKETVEFLMTSRSREVKDLASGIFEKYS